MALCATVTIKHYLQVFKFQKYLHLAVRCHFFLLLFDYATCQVLFSGSIKQP